MKKFGLRVWFEIRSLHFTKRLSRPVHEAEITERQKTFMMLIYNGNYANTSFGPLNPYTLGNKLTVKLTHKGFTV
jgi:hypothetical protein